MTFKQNVYEQCRQALLRKQGSLDLQWKELLESAANETKSTAGDKHETALAMLQIEQERIRRQLDETKDQLALLERIDIRQRSETAVTGSLVRTDRGYFFISLGLGKITTDKGTVMTLSPLSPLGQKLLGTKVFDRVEMNGNEYAVLEIC